MSLPSITSKFYAEQNKQTTGIQDIRYNNEESPLTSWKCNLVGFPFRSIIKLKMEMKIFGSMQRSVVKILSILKKMWFGFNIILSLKAIWMKLVKWNQSLNERLKESVEETWQITKQRELFPIFVYSVTTAYLLAFSYSSDSQVLFTASVVILNSFMYCLRSKNQSQWNCFFFM